MRPTVNDLMKVTAFWGFVLTPYGKLFLAGNDDGIAVRYYHGYPYEPQSLAQWQRMCAGAGCVIDVGAHTGIYSLAAYHAGVTRVISIEPYHANFARLTINLRANGYASDGCLYGAASKYDGMQMYKETSRCQHYLSAGGVVGVDGAYPVRAFRLDSLIPEHEQVCIRAIKIDVEGHARRVLEGMPHLLTQAPDLLLEVTEDDLTDVLVPFRYRFYLVDEEGTLEETATLIPQRHNGKPHMSKLNYYCTVTA